LKGVLEREKAPIGIFISLADVTKPMITEAASAGFYDTGFGKFPRLQILTVQDLFDGKRPQIPFGHSEGYKKAAKEKGGKQEKLL
jgi:site-specific DNA-methyltransferase (adenine-specific)